MHAVSISMLLLRWLTGNGSFFFFNYAQLYNIFNFFLPLISLLDEKVQSQTEAQVMIQTSWSKGARNSLKIGFFVSFNLIYLQTYRATFKRSAVSSKLFYSAFICILLHFCGIFSGSLCWAARGLCAENVNLNEWLTLLENE